MLYLRDTCLTLRALLRCHPPAALCMLRHGSNIAEALGEVHDVLVPSLQRMTGVRQAPRLWRCTLHVEVGSESLVAALLHACLEAHEGVRLLQPSHASEAGSSSSSNTERQEALARGEALLSAVMALAGHGEAAGFEVNDRATGGGAGGMTLPRALTHRYGLGGAIASAAASGVVGLDDAQRDYLAALLGVSSLDSAAASPGPPNPAPSPTSGAPRREDGGGGCGGSRRGPTEMDEAVLLSTVAQVGGCWWDGLGGALCRTYTGRTYPAVCRPHLLPLQKKMRTMASRQKS